MPFNGSMTGRVKNQVSLGNDPSRCEAPAPAGARKSSWSQHHHSQTPGFLKSGSYRNSANPNTLKSTDCADDKRNESNKQKAGESPKKGFSVVLKF